MKTYPTFKDPSLLEPGTSLCKLGFPFHEVKATFNEGAGNFQIDQSIFPILRFPIEGIFTREIKAGKPEDKKFDIKYLETSSPGLKGQSGGPTFDTKGRVWAMQSKTISLDLGFSPKIERAKRVVEENQFLNVGIGSHVETILHFLDENKVSYKKE